MLRDRLQAAINDLIDVLTKPLALSVDKIYNVC